MQVRLIIITSSPQMAPVFFSLSINCKILTKSTRTRGSCQQKTPQEVRSGRQSIGQSLKRCRRPHSLYIINSYIPLDPPPHLHKVVMANCARITARDILATNGVVHVVDKVNIIAFVFVINAFFICVAVIITMIIIISSPISTAPDDPASHEQPWSDSQQRLWICQVLKGTQGLGYLWKFLSKIDHQKDISVFDTISIYQQDQNILISFPGLLPLLDDPTGHFTVFAPTDEAIAKLDK